MARKKKASHRDTRGYSQGGALPQSSSSRQQNATAAKSKKTASPSVSTKTHNEMKDLLGQFHSSEKAAATTTTASSSRSSSSAPANRPSDRFLSRLTNVVHRLDELGFTSHQVEQVVKSLRYEITLETALDWLCLNLTALELPALFTDGDVRQDMSTVTTAESLTVLQHEGGGGSGELHPDNILDVDHLVIKDDAIRENGQDEAQMQKDKEHKNWLLQQYQYEQGEEGEEEDESSPTTQEEDPAIMAVQALTPEEQQLAEEEKALAELEADVNNDANNYMRSKAEIKELRIQAKRLKGKVAGLRRKVERNKAQERQQQQQQRPQLEKEKELEKKNEEVDTGSAPVVVEEEAEECGGGFFDMFAKDDGGGNEEEEAAEEKTPSEPPKNYTIPKGWTGSTPQLKLEEVLKKQKLPRAKYNKLPMNKGLRLAVTMDKKQPSQKWEAQTSDFQEGSSLKDYLATQALYSIDSSLPLYQIFPPPFRDLWLHWMNQRKEEKDQAQKVQDDAKRERMDHLLSLISSEMQKNVDQTKDGAKSDNKNNNNLRDGQSDDDGADNENNSDAIIDNWDDETDDDVPMRTNTPPTRSTKGKKLQSDFVKRQTSAPYKKMKAVRDSLPMASYRSNVLETVENSPVTILCAETGAGKSTQCAQYILEQALLDGHGDEVNIICTQPRRVAATSLAERVAEEMSDGLGKLVGYQIRMESKRSAHTRLLFCTTGVILRRLQDDPALSGITHIIVDEVHERQQQIDVLLIILRQLLQTTRPDLKVVLMSATMETELFRSFFHGSPMISVPGRTFPVSSYYLEDLLDATGHIIEEGSRYAFRENHYGDTASLWVTTRGGEKRKETVDLTSQFQPVEVSDQYAGYNISTRRSMDRVNEEIINFDLIEDVMKLVTNGSHTLEAPGGADMTKGAILIFLPGLGEIKALIERLEGSRLFRDRQRFDLIPLHSTLSSRDQRRAFLPSKPGCRKIICATNIAETSVTIPDVVCVVDCGRVREVRRNKKTSTSMLVTDWCPQSSAKQRQGRAGRVQPGICLKLYSSTTAESVMKENSEPELRRVPLEEVCMTLLGSGFATSCMDFLDQAPQPPSKESVQAAMNMLYEVGAIEITSNTLQQSERLTPLGKHLSKLPVDVKLGKMLIYGALFRCIDPILTIAASLSSKSPFSAQVNDAAVAKAKQRAFADSDSDFVTLINVWDAYSAAAETSASAGRRFCQQNFLNQVALREIGDARAQFLNLLSGIGFLDSSVVMGDSKKLKSCYFNHHARKADVVHTVLCAGLYPNVARLEQSASMSCSMWHDKERIYFHNTSVNAKKKSFSNAENWLVFHEKFGTPNRTSVSTTAFVHPFALLLFGGSVVVNHTERIVMIDDWMSIGMSAQTGVILRELRRQVDLLLQRMIECANSKEIQQLDSSMIDGIINILVS